MSRIDRAYMKQTCLQSAVTECLLKKKLNWTMISHNIEEAHEQLEAIDTWIEAANQH